jgi:peptide/nickel transport system substrate-binding protein
VVFAAQAERRRALIEAGEVDVVESVPAAMAGALGARGLIETAALASGRKSVVVFNCARPPFDDLRVREAVALAIDRDALRRELYGDAARALDGVYAPGDAWGTTVAPIVCDPARARQKLREAGIDSLQAAGVASSVHPTAIVAARIVEMLRAIGITVELKTYDDPPWWPFIYLRSPWQIAFHNMSARPHPDILFGRDFRSRGAFNAGFYSSPALDRLWADAGREPDAARQRALYDAAQRQVRADLPFVPLWATDSLVGWRPGVTGMHAHPMGFVDLAAIDMPDT